MRRRKMSRMARREELAGYLGIMPWVIGFLAFSAIPIFISFGLGFTEYKVFAPPQWVGLTNFAKLFSDPLGTPSVARMLPVCPCEACQVGSARNPSTRLFCFAS